MHPDIIFPPFMIWLVTSITGYPVSCCTTKPEEQYNFFWLHSGINLKHLKTGSCKARSGIYSIFTISQRVESKRLHKHTHTCTVTSLASTTHENPQLLARKSGSYFLPGPLPLCLSKRKRGHKNILYYCLSLVLKASAKWVIVNVLILSSQTHAHSIELEDIE